MQTAKETRRQRLLWLINTKYAPYKQGGCRLLAEATGRTASTYSQIVTGFRGMGDRMARALEIEHGLREGTMDTPLHPDLSGLGVGDLVDAAKIRPNDSGEVRSPPQEIPLKEGIRQRRQRADTKGKKRSLRNIRKTRKA